RRDLFFGPVLERRLDTIGDRFERRHADRPLLARLQQAGDEFLALEPLARAILLHHHVGDFVDPLVAGESFSAFEALAPAPDGLAFPALTRVHDFVAQVTAVGTLHRVIFRALYRMTLLRLMRQPSNAVQVQADLRGEHQAQKQRWSDGEEMEHDRGANGRAVGGTEKDGDGDAKGPVKSAYCTSRR